MDYVAIGCGVLLAVIFAVSAAGKARTATAFTEFADSLTTMHLAVPRARHTIAAGVILAEAAVVVALAVPGGARFAFPAAAALLTIFALGVAVTVRRGVQAPCLCFGARSARPMDGVTVARNAALAAVAVLGAIALAAPAADTVHPAGVVLAVAAAAIAALLVLRLDDIAELFTVRQEH